MNTSTETQTELVDQDQGELAVVEFSDIRIDESLNCRGAIQLSDLTELAEDIKQNTQLQPVVLRYRHDDETFPEPYMLVAGFSRSLAMSKILKLPRVKALILSLTKKQCAIINAAENIKRRNLNIMQEANAISRLVRMGLTREQIAESLGESIGWVQPRIYLLTLDQPIQDMAAAGYLNLDNVRDLYALKDPNERLVVARKIKEKRQNGERRGIKVKFETKDKRKSMAKIARQRTRVDIENLQDYLDSINFPPGIHLRFLAWAGGFITDMQLLAEIQTFFMEAGKPDFYPPTDGIPNMNEEERALH